MGDDSLLEAIFSGELENAGQRGPGGKEKQWTECVAEDRRVFGITEDWSIAALHRRGTREESRK